MNTNAVLAGQLKFLNLGDVLQLLGSNGVSGVLRIMSRYAQEPGVVYLDKGSLIYPQSGTVDPLAFTHVFPQTGTHSVDVGIWNCGMNETEAITDGASLSVVEPDCLIYMPVVLKDY